MSIRIIGGACKRRRLRTARGHFIRPTSDRLRETIFNILPDADIVGAAVIDLFAGTGALGIEALSRGAVQAVFVDRHPAALRLIAANLDACGLAPHGRVIKGSIEKNLNCLNRYRAAFGLAFMDPPYQSRLITATLGHLHVSGCMAAGAWIVAEHSAAETLDEIPSGFRLIRRRGCGKTLVSFLRYMI